MPVTHLGDYSGLQFREEGVLVTIVARNLGVELPPIVQIADLELCLQVRGEIDQKDIAAWFVARREGSGGGPALGA